MRMALIRRNSRQDVEGPAGAFAERKEAFSPRAKRRGRGRGGVSTVRRRSAPHAAVFELAAIVESSDDAIIGQELDGTIVTWNAGAETIYGYSAQEAIGRTISLIHPPERPADLAQIFDKITKGERVHHYDTVRVHKDGRRVDISLTVSPIRDRLGRIIGASGIGRDVTERKRLEERVRRQSEAVAAEYER